MADKQQTMIITCWESISLPIISFWYRYKYQQKDYEKLGVLLKLNHKFEWSIRKFIFFLTNIIIFYVPHQRSQTVQSWNNCAQSVLLKTNKTHKKIKILWQRWTQEIKLLCNKLKSKNNLLYIFFFWQNIRVVQK